MRVSISTIMNEPISLLSLLYNLGRTEWEAFYKDESLFRPRGTEYLAGGGK